MVDGTLLDTPILGNPQLNHLESISFCREDLRQKLYGGRAAQVLELLKSHVAGLKRPIFTGKLNRVLSGVTSLQMWKSYMENLWFIQENGSIWWIFMDFPHRTESVFTGINSHS